MVTTKGTTTITSTETRTTRIPTIRTETTAETITIQTTTTTTEPGTIRSATHTTNSNGTAVSNDVYAHAVPLTMVSAERQLNVHNKSINKHNQSVQNDIERLTNETPVSDNFRTLNDTNEVLSSDFSDFDHTVSFNSLCNHSIVSEAQFPISSNICLNNSCHTPDAASRESWFKKKGLNIMHLNIHYLHSKLDEIKILLYEQPNIDIICLCETFLTDKFTDEELVLDNYQLFRKDRNTHGGGLVIYVKNN